MTERRKIIWDMGETFDRDETEIPFEPPNLILEKLPKKIEESI